MRRRRSWKTMCAFRVRSLPPRQLAPFRTTSMTHGSSCSGIYIGASRAGEWPSSPALYEANYLFATRDKRRISTNFRHVLKRPVQRFVRPIWCENSVRPFSSAHSSVWVHCCWIRCSHSTGYLHLGRMFRTLRWVSITSRLPPCRVDHC